MLKLPRDILSRIFLVMMNNIKNSIFLKCKIFSKLFLTAVVDSLKNEMITSDFCLMSFFNLKILIKLKTIHNVLWIIRHPQTLDFPLNINWKAVKSLNVFQRIAITLWPDLTTWKTTNSWQNKSWSGRLIAKLKFLLVYSDCLLVKKLESLKLIKFMVSNKLIHWWLISMFKPLWFEYLNKLFYRKTHTVVE